MDAQSTIARIRTARHNEDLVLAEGALEAERVVARVRLGLIGFMALGTAVQSLLTHQRLPLDPWLVAAVLVYLTLAAGNAVFLRGVAASVRGAELAPLAYLLVDYGCLTLFQLRVFSATHAPALGSLAAVYAVILCFSVGRRRAWHVAVSCACACFCFAVAARIEEPGAAALPQICIVHGSFAALALLVGRTGTRTRRMFLGLRRRENLSRFVPHAVADRLVRFGEEALEPTQREVTILFCDLRDFTALSEQLAPRAVLELLDAHFADLTQIVQGRGGMVAKLIGDGLMAVWGAPDRQEDHAAAALAAALDMRRKLAERNAERARAGGERLRMGIGVHSGAVAAGMLGGAEQHEYTVIGDAVNLASRVEGLTKEQRVDILVTDATWRLAGGRFRGERLAELRVKGREEPVVVWRLDGHAGEEDLLAVG